MSQSKDERQGLVLKRGERIVETNNMAERKCNSLKEQSKAAVTIVHSDVTTTRMIQTIDDNMRTGNDEES